MPPERRLSRATRALRRAVCLRCPRCGGAPLFRTRFSMARECALCGSDFERALNPEP